MFRKIFITFAVLVAALAFLGGCGQKNDQVKAATPGKTKITDMAGREVEVPVPATKVVAIGPGALRLLCYVNGADKIAGVEDIEKKQPTGRPYIWPIRNLNNYPPLARGGRILPRMPKSLSASSRM